MYFNIGHVFNINTAIADSFMLDLLLVTVTLLSLGLKVKKLKYKYVNFPCTSKNIQCKLNMQIVYAQNIYNFRNSHLESNVSYEFNHKILYKVIFCHLQSVLMQFLFS
jgi:hypothetical protein